MKKAALFIFFIGRAFLCRAEDTFQELKGQHFIIYYYPQHVSFAKEVLSHAENYYIEIANDLGYERYSEFWLWDKRVKIYIYKDHHSFIKASNQPSWSHGVADYTNKTIMSYFKGEGFLESILPHEIAHLMFRDFVGFKGEIPLWLDEGVAQWAEKAKRKDVKRLIKETYKNKKMLSLRDMMTMDIRGIKNDDEIYVRYANNIGEPIILVLTGENLINLYYLESVSLVGFLIEKYGAKKFTLLCRQLRDGKNIKDALKTTYPHSVKNMEMLEKEWRKYYRGEK
jgi:hypothetical protein